jgi:hypothetical protein
MHGHGHGGLHCPEKQVCVYRMQCGEVSTVCVWGWRSGQYNNTVCWLHCTTSLADRPNGRRPHVFRLALRAELRLLIWIDKFSARFSA